MTSVQVDGIKETLQTLNKLDRELRKEFNRDAKEIVRPLTENAKNNMPTLPLSGMSLPWLNPDTGRLIQPWSVNKAKNGVQLKIDTRKSKQAAISVISKDVWATIYDDAGKATDNRLARNLTQIYGPSPRALWRGVGRLRRPVINELIKRVEQAERTAEKELERR
jgi:hypothetical protein